MIFLLLAILFLFASVLPFYLIKTDLPLEDGTSAPTKGDKTNPFELIDAKKDAANKAGEEAEKNKKQLFRIIISMGCICVALLFGILTIITTKSTKSVHSLQLSYEGLGVYRLGQELRLHFSDDSSKGIVDTIVVTPNSDNIYIKELVTQLYNGLGTKKFNIVQEYSVKLPDVKGSNYELLGSHLEEILLEQPDTKLVISLAGFNLDKKVELDKDSPRPYLVVFSEKAELNDYVWLINQGMVDLALLSKATYSSHSIIPNTRTVEEIFSDHYLLINATNIGQIVKEFKQTISHRVKTNKGNNSAAN